MKLGIPQVVLWTLGVYLATNLAILLVLGLKPHADPDPLVSAAVLAAMYLGAASLFASRRPGRSWSDTFAMRRTSIWLVLFAAVLGVAMYLPALTLANFIEHLRPMAKPAHEPLEHSLAYEVLYCVFAAGVCVVAEELMFRGAFFTGLRPLHSAVSAAWTTSVLFTLTHGEPRFWPSILGLAVLLAVVRGVSGSLWPSVFMHGAFNGTALGMPFANPELEHPSAALVAGCGAASIVLVGVIVWIGNVSKSADRARRVDLEPDPGLGETLS